MTIGELVQQYCLSHGITNQQFAELSHVSKAYISMLVNGKNPKTGKPPVPSVKTYQKIADAMGITMHDLLEETEKDTPSYFHAIPSGASTQTGEQDQSYRGLADAIVEKLRQSEDLGIVADDELMQMREDMRRNPELRVLYDLQRKASKKELKQMEAFIKAIRSSNDQEDEDPD